MAKNIKNNVLSKQIEEKHHPDELLRKDPCDMLREKLIVIGSSTGGTDALQTIFTKLPSGLPPIVLVQHIPKIFSASLAKRLDSCSQVNVSEVNEKMQLNYGCAYIANGDNHILLSYERGKYSARPQDGIRISRHKPSVDVLFRSANNACGKHTLAIILTGMGDDGSIGIKELFDNGAYTIAQDKKSCIVFGMPKKAIETGGIREVVPLESISDRIIEYANNQSKFKNFYKA